MEGELAVDVRGGGPVTVALQRLLHRNPEGLAVELEYVRPRDLPPERGLLELVLLEFESSVKQREAVVDLEAADRELGCAAKPRERPRSQLRELALLAG